MLDTKQWDKQSKTYSNKYQPIRTSSWKHNRCQSMREEAEDMRVLINQRRQLKTWRVDTSQLEQAAEDMMDSNQSEKQSGQPMREAAEDMRVLINQRRQLKTWRVDTSQWEQAAEDMMDSNQSENQSGQPMREAAEDIMVLTLIPTVIIIIIISNCLLKWKKRSE